jgi:hypothetical protein
MEDSLRRFIDESYSVGSDSIDWSNDALVTHTGNEYENVAFMEHRYFKYTAFVPQDKRCSPTNTTCTTSRDTRRSPPACTTPSTRSDRDITDPTDRRNSLNRFISYHILPRLGQLLHADGRRRTELLPRILLLRPPTLWTSPTSTRR